MPSSRLKPSSASRLQGALAWLLAGLVLALSLLAAAPSLHERLHPRDPAKAAAAHDDAGCAVTLFGHGVTTPPDLPRVAAPAAAWHAGTPRVGEDLRLSAAPHLHPPGRGPPRLG